jgi:hypothetical protein
MNYTGMFSLIVKKASGTIKCIITVQIHQIVENFKKIQ